MNIRNACMMKLFCKSYLLVFFPCPIQTITGQVSYHYPKTQTLKRRSVILYLIMSLAWVIERLLGTYMTLKTAVPISSWGVS